MTSLVTDGEFKLHAPALVGILATVFLPDFGSLLQQVNGGQRRDWNPHLILRDPEFYEYVEFI